MSTEVCFSLEQSESETRFNILTDMVFRDLNNICDLLIQLILLIVFDLRVIDGE